MKEAPLIKIPLRKYINEAIANPIKMRTQIFEKYGPLARKKTFGQTSFYVGHPLYVEHMLDKNQDNYFNKHSALVKTFFPFIGGSIFITNDFMKWYKDRLIAKLSFENEIYFKEYSKTIISLCDKMLDRWDQTYKNHQMIDVPLEIDSLLIEIVISTLFTQFNLLNPKELAQVAGPIVEDIKTKMRFIPPALWFLHPSKKKYEAGVDYLRNLSQSIVRERLKENKEWDDMLGNFIRESKGWTEEAMIQMIGHHIATFLVVGYFTTAALLHWSLVAFSKNPLVEAKVCSEVDQIIGNRQLNYEDLNTLPFLSATIKETLRMYPSSHTIMREAIEKDEVNGYKIDAKAGVILSIPHIHRHPDFWENPEGFDPRRFINNPLGQESKYAYIPFGMGKRNCIASAFATMEATLIIPMILRRYRLSLPAHADVQPFTTSLLTNRPNVQYMSLLKK